MRAASRPGRGFTLVELITIIGIVAILAAVIFPVFATLRVNVRKRSCISNLHSIAQAVKMYKDDYRVYPEALYGYWTPSDETQGELERTFLYPQYITSRSGFRCPMNPRGGTAPDPGRRMAGFNGVTGLPTGRWYYDWDSYDGTRTPHTDPNSPYLVHYLRQWDGRRLGVDENVSTQQLIYRYPPDATVITWCTYHRDYRQDAEGNLVIEPGGIDLVLFLDGRAKSVPSTLTLVDAQAHQVTPGI